MSIPILLSTIIPVTMMTSISLSSFQNYSSYAEKLATVLVQQEMGLELMLLIITDEYYYRKSISSDYNSITINGASTGTSTSTSTSTGSIIVDNNNSNNKTTNQEENTQLVYASELVQLPVCFKSACGFSYPCV